VVVGGRRISNERFPQRFLDLPLGVVLRRKRGGRRRKHTRPPLSLGHPTIEHRLRSEKKKQFNGKGRKRRPGPQTSPSDRQRSAPSPSRTASERKKKRKGRKKLAVNCLAAVANPSRLSGLQEKKGGEEEKGLAPSKIRGPHHSEGRESSDARERLVLDSLREKGRGEGGKPIYYLSSPGLSASRL